MSDCSKVTSFSSSLFQSVSGISDESTTDKMLGKTLEKVLLLKDTYTQQFPHANWTHKHLAILIDALELTFYRAASSVLDLYNALLSKRIVYQWKHFVEKLQVTCVTLT